MSTDTQVRRPGTSRSWPLVFAIMLGGHCVAAQVGTFVRVDIPGAHFTRPNDVNNAGVIVGAFEDGNGARHGFVWNGGALTVVDYPGAGTTTLIGINDLGQVVGRFVFGGVEHGFLLSNGTYQQIDFPGAVDTQCHGIDRDGRIVGRYFDYKNGGQGGGSGRQQEHGYVLDDGVFTSIDYPDSATTDAWKIGDNGDVIGDWSTSGAIGFNGAVRSGAVHGYLLHDGQYTTLDYPGALITASRDANANAQIVGIYVDDKFVDHGFVSDGGAYNSFDFPGAAWTDGNAINDNGVIVGSYGDGAGVEHGFVAAIERN